MEARKDGGLKEPAAWQRERDLAAQVYAATRSWPKEERSKLTKQVRKAAVSMPSYVAEGHASSGLREFYRHASIAVGSLAEVEAQISIANRFGYFNEERTQQLLERIIEARRPLSGLPQLLRSLKT